MLPIHIFHGSTHYVLVRRGAVGAVGVDGAGGDDRVEGVAARDLLEAALRRGSPGLLAELATLLNLRGHEPEHVARRSLAALTAFDGEILLLRRRGAARSLLGRDPVGEADEYERPNNEFETHWIEVQLFSDGPPCEPIPRARYEIELPNGQIVTGRLDDQGMVRLDDIAPGECQVRFPDYDEADPEGEVEPEDKLCPVAVPPGTCEISRVEIECQHYSKRGHKLSLPATRTKSNEVVQVLEVIGAGKGEGDRIKVATTLAGPRCAEHSTNCINVLRPEPAQPLSFAKNFAEFTADYGPAKYQDWLWPWNAKPAAYQILQRTCDAKRRHSATILVYPDYQVSVAIAIVLDASEASKAQLAKTRKVGKVGKVGRPEDSTWSFSIEGAMSYGTKSFKLSAAYESELRNLQTINRWVKLALDKFCTIFKTFFGLELELLLPNVSLKYNGKFVELQNSYKVDKEWSLVLSAAPLFGVRLKIDLLELALKALQKTPAAAVASVLLELKNLANKHDNKLELVINLSGNVGFELSASKNAGQRKVQAHANPVGEITVGLEAAFAFSGSRWCISFEASGTVSGATGVTITPGVVGDDEGVALAVKLLLKPLVYEWAFYASGKVGWEFKKGYGHRHEIWKEKTLMEGKKYIVQTDATAVSA